MMPSVRAAACCIASRVLPRGVAPILRPPLRPNSQITTAAAAVEAAAEVRQWRGVEHRRRRCLGAEGTREV